MSGASLFREIMAEPSKRTIVAYDNMDWSQIIHTAEEVGPYTGLGKTNAAHVSKGAAFAVRALGDLGQLTMLDSKYHDIPQTVENSVYEAASDGASLITVHTTGGVKMMEAAVRGRDQARQDIKNPLKKPARDLVGNLLGITILTSLEEDAYSIYGLDKNDRFAIRNKVLELTRMALDAGLDGVVCSPQEADAIKSDSKLCNMLVVTPGITPEFATKANDQARTTSAREAIKRGADMIVVGRGINKANDYGMTKKEAALAVSEEIQDALIELRS